MIRKPHRHAAFIHAYADGAKIQMLIDNNDNWMDVDQPDWSGMAYRIKKEFQYPPSTLSYGSLCDIVNAARKLPGLEGDETKIARLAADMAVAEFIESGAMRDYLESLK